MRRLAAGACVALLLTGCSSGLSPAGRLQDRTATLVQEANAGSLAGLRGAAADLRTEIEAQERQGQLTPARARLLLLLLSRVEHDAPLVTGEPSPTPSATPSPSASPSPSPSPSPSLSPTPSPSPSPSLSPTPSPTPSATPSSTGSPSPLPTLALSAPG